MSRKIGIAGVVLLTVASACGRYRPEPLDAVPFRERAHTKSEDGLQVTVAIPSEQESRRLFGVSLADEKIQPVWLDIVNNTADEYWFFPVGLDPSYFTPFEAANRCRYLFSSAANEKMREYFSDSAIGSHVGPGASINGFVFTNLDRGVKAVNVDLVGPDRFEQMFFMVKVPGFRSDYEEVEVDDLYDATAIRDVNEEELRAALAAMPCCATTRDGRGIEDPLNFVLLGTADDVFPNFVRTGWRVTEILHGSAALQTFRSYFFGSEYQNAPISSVYLFGRRQDLSLQKPRATARQRNHLRIWLTPLRFEGKPVWIGQISRDIGLIFSWKNIVGHEVDPDVDEARNYLFQDMLRSEGLARFGWVSGVGPASPEDPHHMDDGTPFFTDGLRAVMLFQEEATSFSEIRPFRWEKVPPR